MKCRLLGKSGLRVSESGTRHYDFRRRVGMGITEG
jgi:hypothetical protein